MSRAVTAELQSETPSLGHRTLQEIDAGTGERIGSPVGVEAFADARVLVILGDPGAGKTTLLKTLARTSGGFVTARRAANADGGLPALPPLIDGLDEVTGDITAAMEVISARLSLARAPRVVISCRVQDWRTGAARRQLEETYGVDVVRVAVLQPLDQAGALAVLDGRTPDPEAFIRTARSKGLQAFLENPNDLLLLVDATANGWPNSRTELLEGATGAVLSETNDFHADRLAVDLEALKTASGWVSATLLIAGIDDTAANGSDLADPKPAGLNADTVRLALKSRLFSGPATGRVHFRHKTIAEYLAGRWLATIVDTASMDGRIRALILAPDGLPPASLRAVYAWLVHFLEPQRVDLWIDADPVSLVLHGDAAAFSDRLKIQLLDALARQVEADPSLGGYVDQGDRWVGLYSPGTITEINARLVDPSTPTILKSHLLDGAAAQPAPPTLIPTLLALACDASVERDVRRRAVRAYLKAGGDETPIWAAVGAMNANVDLDPDFIFRAEVLRHVPTLTVPKLHGVIAALFCTTTAVPLGRISYTFEHLSTADLPALLDGLLQLPRPKRSLTGAGRRLSADPDNVMLRVLRRLMQEAPDQLTDDRLVGLHKSSVLNLSLGAPQKTRLIELAQRPSAVSRLYDEVAAGPATGLAQRFFRAFPFGEPLLLAPDGALIHRMIADLRATIDPVLGPELCQCILNAGIDLEALGVSADLEQIIGGRSELAPWRPRIGPSDRAFQTTRHQEREAAQQAKIDEVLAGWRGTLRSDRSGIVDWTDAETLQWLGDLYMGHPSLGFGTHSQKRRAANLSSALGNDLAGEVVFDLMRGLGKAGPSLATRPALLAAMDLTHTQFPDQITRSDLVPDPIASELLLAWIDEGGERYDPFTGQSLSAEGWPARLIKSRTALVRRVLVDHIVEGLVARHDHVTGLYQLGHAEEFSEVRAEWAAEILSRVPDVPPDQAEDLFRAALTPPYPVALAASVRGVLARLDLRADARARWSAVGWLLDPVDGSDGVRSVLASGARSEVWAVIATVRGSGRKASVSQLTEAQLSVLTEALVRRFPYVPTPSGAWGGHVNGWDGTELVIGLLHELGRRGTEFARDALRTLAKHALDYEFEIRQALLAASTMARDVAFADRDARKISAALLGGPPASLREGVAIVEAELRDLERWYRTGDLSEWRSFWNLDGDSRTSKAVRIKGENECRNALVSDLRPRLRAFSLRPEAATANMERLDIAVEGAHGMFPIEVKLDDNADLWTAAASQLSERYANDYKAGGFGVYLAIWTARGRGNPVTRLPDGSRRPETAAELEDQLKARLSELDRERVAVVVIDLSAMT